MQTEATWSWFDHLAEAKRRENQGKTLAWAVSQEKARQLSATDHFELTTLAEAGLALDREGYLRDSGVRFTRETSLLCTLSEPRRALSRADGSATDACGGPRWRQAYLLNLAALGSDARGCPQPASARADGAVHLHVRGAFAARLTASHPRF